MLKLLPRETAKYITTKINNAYYLKSHPGKHKFRNLNIDNGYFTCTYGHIFFKCFALYIAWITSYNGFEFIQSLIKLSSLSHTSLDAEDTISIIVNGVSPIIGFIGGYYLLQRRIAALWILSIWFGLMVFPVYYGSKYDVLFHVGYRHFFNRLPIFNAMAGKTICANLSLIPNIASPFKVIFKLPLAMRCIDWVAILYLCLLVISYARMISVRGFRYFAKIAITISLAMLIPYYSYVVLSIHIDNKLNKLLHNYSIASSAIIINYSFGTSAEREYLLWKICDEDNIIDHTTNDFQAK